LKQFLV